MASASRPSRFSPRTSSPFPSQQHRNSAHQNMPLMSRTDMGSSNWVEPPLRPPVPSFMDHKGLERQGVLEQMVALGVPPTAKIKARSKGDSFRRGVQARNSEDTVMDDARATPDFTTNAMFAAARTPSISGREVTRSAGAIDANPPPGAARSGSASLQNTPHSRTSKTLMPPSPSTDGIEKALNQAALMALQNGRPDVEERLINIRAAALHDPEFATLLNFAVTNNSLNERGSAINRKLKQLKTSLRSQDSSPQSLHDSFNGVTMSSTSLSRSPSQSLPRSTAQTNNKDGQTIAKISNLTSSTSPLLQQSSSLKLCLKPPHASNGFTKGYMLTSPKMKHETIHTRSRRSSSSSLSSVDEGLAAGPPPSSSLDRSNIQINSVYKEFLLDEDDTEVELRKESFKKKFPAIAVVESHERPAVVPNTASALRIDPFKPFPKLKLNGPSDALRNGLEQASYIPSVPSLFDSSSVGLKRKVTPLPITPTNLGRPPKRLKATAKIKMSPQKHQQPAVIAGIARSQNRRHTSAGFDDLRSEHSENNDYCFTCSGTGYLLCCDGCDRAFHFTCLDPPLDEKATLDGPWLCHACKGERGLVETAGSGLFGELQKRITSKNPTSFILPDSVRDYFEGVHTGTNGEYLETTDQKPNNTKGRMGYDEPPNLRRLKDDKGNVILCHRCLLSALNSRHIISCDYCENNWHLDCLDPPLANPPNRGQNGKSRPKWRCPLHSEHDLQHLDPIEQNGVRYDGMGRTHKVRRPKNAKIVIPALPRGFKNSGLIEIESESSDETSELEEEAPDGVIYKLPAEAVKLDFIDRVKSKRQSDAQATFFRAYAVQLRDALLRLSNSRRMSNDLMRRSLRDQIGALNLAQFARSMPNIDVGPTQVDNFIFTVVAETPASVIELLDRAATYEEEEAKRQSRITDVSALLSGANVRPFSKEQRLLAKSLIELLQARLGESEPEAMVNGE